MIDGSAGGAEPIEALALGITERARNAWRAAFARAGCRLVFSDHSATTPHQIEPRCRFAVIALPSPEDAIWPALNTFAFIRMPVIFLTDGPLDAPAVERARRMNGSRLLSASSPPSGTLVSAIRSASDWFVSRLDRAPLPDLLQMMGGTEPAMVEVSCVHAGVVLTTRELAESCVAGGRACTGFSTRIYLKHGRLQHVDGTGGEGIEALGFALELRRGEMKVHELYIQPSAPNVQVPVQVALLDAAVQVDERARSEGRVVARPAQATLPPAWPSPTDGIRLGDRPITQEIPLVTRGVPNRPVATPAPTTRELAVGQVVGRRYTLDARIGAGSVSRVFRATDRVLDTCVAIKVLMLGGLDIDVVFEQGMLRKEATAAMALGHPNIVRVYHYESEGTNELLIMEHVAGGDCRARQMGSTNQRMPVAEVMQIGLQCLDALAYAHGRGIVHHDIKPGNILLTETGFAKLCDFGLARFSSVGGPADGARHPRSPEWVRGKVGDHRSDLFCLAASLYVMANGEPPLGPDALTMMTALKAGQTPGRGALPPSIYQVILRALAFDPSDRFPNAAAMKVSLAAACRVDSVRPSFGAPHRSGADTRRPPPLPLEITRDVEFYQADKLISLEEVQTEPPHLIESPTGMVRVDSCRLKSSYTSDIIQAPAFFLDINLVRNEDYLAFVEVTRHVPPPHWHGWRPPQGLELHPVVNVALEDAEAYAAWLGKRLPTSAEWEIACRGPSGAPFPWGEATDEPRYHGDMETDGMTAPVGEYVAGMASCGCLDLVGNVWEWTARAEGERVAVFGGSYRHPCTWGGGVARSKVSVNNRYDYLGFRCAKSLAR